MKRKVLAMLLFLIISLTSILVLLSLTPIEAQGGTSAIIEVSQAKQLTTDLHYDRNPSVFKANDGTYWLFFVRATSDLPHIPPAYNPDSDSYNVYYMTSVDGVNWSPETNLTVCSTGQRGMAAFQDANGTIWVFTSAPGNNSILYFKSTDGGDTWTGPFNTGYTGSHVDAFQASDGKIWVFYEDSTGIEAIKSSDGGSHWSHVTGIGPSPDDGIPKAMEADGKIYVVWCNWNVGGKAWYTYSTDGLGGDGWNDPQLLVDVPGTIMCDPVMVKNGSEYVLFYAPWDTATDAQWIEVITSTDLSTWSNRSRVTSGGYGTTYWWDMWPEVLVDGSDLYLFYGSEKNGTQRGDGNIFMYEVDWNLTHDHCDAIQPAIDYANPGDIIKVHEGTYTEQLIIDKSLTLIGDPKPKIIAPDIRTTFTIPESGDIWDPIIFAYGSLTGTETINVTIEGFEINGGNKAASSSTFVAVLYRNVKPGVISDNNIRNMYPPSGKGSGPETLGIAVYGDSNGEIRHNEIMNFSRVGIFIAGDAGPNIDPTVTIQENVIFGNGLENESGWWAENGIQVGYGATASIQDNEVYDCTVNSTGWAATGILIVDTEEGAVVDGNHIEGCDVGISAVDFPSVYGPPWNYSILLNVLITNNTLIANTWQIDISNDARNVTVAYNDIINATGDGIDVWSYFGDVFPVDVEIHYNNIEGSGSYGLWADENLTETVDARYNWWGDSSGPSHSSNSGGTGDAISDNVDYSPWLGASFETTPRTYHVNPTGTIQEAIDAASLGETIIVHEGTYTGAVIAKGIRIYEAPGETAVITDGVPYKTGSTLYTAFRLDQNADGTEIRGFTINCNSSKGFYFAVFSRGVDNVIIDSLIVNDAVQGITNWGGSNWIVRHNVLNNTEAAGGGGIAIWMGAYPPDYPVCSGNIVYNNTITATATAPDYTCPGIAIGLDLRWGAYDDLTGNEDLSNNQILNNNITAPGALNGVGIEMGVLGLEGNETKIAATLGLIHDNTIQGNNIDGADLGIYLYTIINMTILENEIKNCNEGIHIEDGISNLIINYNNIFGNGVGINNTAEEYIDARYNWWGSPEGPTASPQAGDKIVGKIYYEPWLIEPYPPAILVEALLYISPEIIDYWTVSSGKTFTVDVKIANVTNLHACEFKLYWDTTLLDLVEVQITPPWGAYFIAKNETDEVLGRYWLSMGSLGTSTFNGSTTLVKLTFKITFDPVYPENRTCMLDLLDTKLSAREGVPIYHMTHDGKYSIYSTKPKIIVEPSTYTAHALNEIFIVNITVQEAVNLYNFSFKISYNTTILDAINLEVGSFLNPPIYTYKFIIDDANGLVWLWAWSESPAPPASGSGVLARITFKATKATTWTQYHPNILSCALDLHDTLLVTNNGIEVEHDVVDGMYRYEPKPGDLDMDGYVGLTDLRILAYYYDPSYDPIADLNEDGKVDVYDLSILASHYGEDC